MDKIRTGYAHHCDHDKKEQHQHGLERAARNAHAARKHGPGRRPGKARRGTGKLIQPAFKPWEVFEPCVHGSEPRLGFRAVYPAGVAQAVENFESCDGLRRHQRHHGGDRQDRDGREAHGVCCHGPRGRHFSVQLAVCRIGDAGHARGHKRRDRKRPEQENPSSDGQTGKHSCHGKLLAV